jgi:hypothetical protein
MLLTFVSLVICRRLSEKQKNEPVFWYEPNIGKNEAINISMKDTNEAVLMWGLSSTVHIKRGSKITETDPVRALLLSESSVVEFDRDVSVEVWFIPKGLCPDGIVVYSFSDVFRDSLSGQDSVCFFVQDCGEGTRVSVDFSKQNSKSKSKSKLESKGTLYRGDSDPLSFHQGYESRVDDSVFGVLELGAHERADISGMRGDVSDSSCIRSELRGRQNENDFECTSDGGSNQSGFGAFLSVIVIVMFGVVVLICIGWLAKLRTKLRHVVKGERDANEDPAQILRGDQIRDLIQIEPVEEDEPHSPT